MNNNQVKELISPASAVRSVKSVNVSTREATRMQSNPLVSVIVPAYNVHQYLDDCISSIVCQTYSNIQIIIVDDGSTDGTSSKCDSWQRRDNRIIAIHKRNNGASSARNRGIQEATGEYCLFVDSDDLIERDAITKLVSCITSLNVDVVSFDIAPFDDRGNLPRNASVPGEYPALEKNDPTGCLEQLYLGNIGNFAPTYFVKKEVIDKLGVPFPEDVALYEDVIYTNKMIRAASTIGFLPEQLYRYRQREGSITKCADSSNAQQGYEVVLKILSLPIEDKLRDCRALYCVRLLFGAFNLIESTNSKRNTTLKEDIRQLIMALSSETKIIRLDLKTNIKVFLLKHGLYEKCRTIWMIIKQDRANVKRI